MGIWDKFRGKNNSQSKQTTLNPNIPAQESSSTVINRDAQLVRNISKDKSIDNRTTINPITMGNTSFASGSIVCGKYTIQRELNVQTGEADLFVCTYQKQEYIAKIYRRQFAIKAEVAHQLSEIKSPYVARVFDMGTYEGYPVEIIPYYRNGSLEGRTFSLEQLRRNIIPSLNEGLQVLHSKGIIHKDLKPANIMLNDDNKTVAIIDFGISSMTEKGNTVVVTHTGLTPEYSAPETFRGLFLAESDYYSLGITIFELSEGHSPYAGMTQEEIAQFAVIQKVPLPSSMNGDLQDLITGLTYNDITNRKEKSNPNRRWGYEEVNNWCNGIKQPIPGTSAGYKNIDGRFRAFRFQGQAYDTMESLVLALATDWENGKKQLFRGTLGGHFNSIDAEIASICGDAQDEMEREERNSDLIFFSTLYKLDQETIKLMWKGHVYDDLDCFAKKWLDAIRHNNTSMDAEVNDMLTNHIFSAYIEIIQPDATEHIRTIKAFESSQRMFNCTGRQKSLEKYRLGYILSSKKELVVGNNAFHGVDELTDYMYELLSKSQKTFDSFTRQLINEQDVLDVQFESWLIAQGQSKAISQWRNEMSGK